MDVFHCSGPERHTWVLADDAAKCCNGYRRARRIRRGTRGDTLEFFWQPVDAPPEHPIMPNPALADSAHQRSLKAGWLVLRLLDRGNRATLKELAAVRRAIDAIADERLRDVLQKLTEALPERASDETASVPALLFGYGLLLETMGEWSLAVDVYETACRYALGSEDRRGLPLVYSRLGFCHRQLEHLAAASQAYTHGRALAQAAGDMAAELRLRNGEGALALHRGDFAGAIGIFEAVMRDARDGGYRDAFARASHDRGHVALMQDADEQAARYFATAFQAYAAPSDRERALEDLASALSRLGARDAARDAFLIAEATAIERETRAQAAINLLRLAAEDGDELGFESHRRAVGDPALLPAWLQAELHWRLADGYGLLGLRAQAVKHCRLLGEIACEHRLNEYAYIAEASWRGLRSRTRGAAPVPESLASVVKDLRVRLRELQL
jgi:tetratricopeptide (TPR) repeat protein